MRAAKAAGVAFAALGCCSLAILIAANLALRFIDLLATNYELAGWALAGGIALILFGIFFKVFYDVIPDEEANE